MVPRSLRCSDPSSLFGAEDLFFCPGGSAKTAFPFFENYEEVNIVKEALNNILAAAKAEILRSTNNNPPALLDPFAGGGAIPLEAQRLGLQLARCGGQHQIGRR